ncbi:DUF4268 domain-containing protein [Mesorhizobium sp. YIM 152430]|uniref:DUF4268 domain-containing protein n=1 Tax=Mesorhizobium sp. YIM 152430 TaxID=3031761 RepID=UPI0023DA33BF|nr:DUF4268 domain-containing protein [Mesorhizobium sp. YIM 152430]MDF1600919.1 DUF4268 domain-containing protein [Mesorhizobium sp. YIM 152430]
MYSIDRTANRIKPLEKKTFAELQFRERDHLQEWIANHPSVLGEELLIIAKEFAGFEETNERLDLLALDTSGALVLIENKLDDAGKDVTWQALKYASYCSGFTKDSVRDIYAKYRQMDVAAAEESIADFLGAESFGEATVNAGLTQRVILVAAHFRKEVTSTVMWLRGFNLRVQCMSAAIHVDEGGSLYFSVEQLIPPKAAEEYMVNLARKQQSEAAAADVDAARYTVRRNFWSKLLPEMGKATTIFQNISPQKSSWVMASSGISGLSWMLYALGTETRVDFYIDSKDAMRNDLTFVKLETKKEEIEQAFGEPLHWEPLPNYRACRIRHAMPANVFDEDQWPNMISSLTERMVRLESAIKPHLKEI